MSLWFEILLSFSLPIFFILILIVNQKLKQIRDVENGIFKANNKIYKHIMLSGLLDFGKDILELGLKIKRKRDEKNNEQKD